MHMKSLSSQGNHPEANHQFYSDEDTLDKFGRLTRIYTSMKNYTKAMVEKNSLQVRLISKYRVDHTKSNCTGYPSDETTVPDV